MFLNDAPSDQDCSSTAEFCFSSVDRSSVTSDASLEQECAFTAETESSESYQAFISDRELRLQAFIQKAHQLSRSDKYPPVLALQLLDRAWEAQKLLWELRQSQTKTPPQADWVCKSWVYRSK